MKNFIASLWWYLLQVIGVESYGRYYTCKDADGYNWFCTYVGARLREEGYNICDRNVKKIVSLIDDGNY